MKLKPTHVQIILFTFIGLLTAANIGLFVLAKQFISTNTTEITKIATEIKSIRNEISKMESVEQQYNEIKDIPPIIDQLFAPSSDKAYQEKLINTLYAHAKDSGIAISNLNLSVNGPKAAKSDSNITIVLSLDSPVDYTNFLKFIKLIEAGLPRMQITNFSISQSNSREGNDNATAISSIQIKVFVR
ncbi:MAG: hypothetical protein Q3996_00065 [Candidatus Saccharibacteria bacterium]|nr:hypothetical protein [Candidatus Saccharibacteria bacterium]